MGKKIRSGLLIILFGYATFLIFDRLAILHQIDKTLSPSYYLEYSASNSSPPPPVYLVSYADGKPVFYKNQNAQTMSAINNGIDHIMMYKRRDIDPEFYQKNKEILDQKAGAGLWIWKSYFMLKTMSHAPENSVIIYADSPVIFKKPITHLLNLLNQYDVLVLRNGSQRKGNVQTAGQHIKREALEYFHIDTPEFHQKDSLWACFVVVRNNANGRLFVEQWLKNCEHKKAIMSEPFDPHHQYPNFLGHPYDQAMLAVAAYQRPEKLYVMDVDEAMQIIKNVHRHPNEEHKSLLPDMVSATFKWFKVSEWGYNSRWIKWLRSFFST